jgi:Collagen triple helix repeat (20 copies)
VGLTHIESGDLMAKSKQQGPRGKQGIPGPPGPTGKTGSVGITGHSGHTGQRGPQGVAGHRGPAGQDSVGGVLPSERRSLIASLHEQIDNIYNELDLQMKRMAQLQVQLDDVRKKMHGLASDSD